MARIGGTKMLRQVRGSAQKENTTVIGLTSTDDCRNTSLKRRLEVAGYKFQFHSESMGLVEKLLEDLNSIKDTHKTLIDRFEDLKSNELSLQRQVEPLQKELGRAIRENNQLHFELIQKSEDHECHLRKQQLKDKKLNAELQDKTFLISQQHHQIRQLEREVAAHKQQIAKLLDKNFTCTVGPAGDVFPKQQEIRMSCVPKPQAFENVSNHGADDGFDVPSLVTTQISDLEKQLESFAAIRSELVQQISFLQKSVQLRDSEIKRMGRLLETHVDSELEELHHRLDEKDDIIRRLNGQIDFLTAQVIDIEGQEDPPSQVSKHPAESEALLRQNAELQRALRAQEAEKENLNRQLEDVLRERGDRSAPEREQDQIRSLEEALASSRARAVAYQEKMNESLAETDRLRRSFAAASRGDGRGPAAEELTRENATLAAELAACEARCGELAEEAREMRRLRDGLAAVVLDFEGQLGSVQGHIRQLSVEREAKDLQIRSLADTLRSAEEEISVLRGSSSANTAASISASAITPTAGAAALAAVPAVLSQGAGAGVGSAVNASGTADSVGSARGVSTALTERLQASVSALQVQLETARTDLNAAIGREREAVAQLTEARARSGELESASRQLQTLVTQLDQARGEAAARQAALAEDHAALRERSRALEEEVRGLRGELRRRDEDAERAKSAMSTVDSERDELLAQLGERAARQEELEAARVTLERERERAQADAAAAAQQADLLRRALAERDAELGALRRGVEGENRRGAALERQLAMRDEEARALASDLAVMTRENQVVNNELAALVAQREALKRDLDNAVERLVLAEQLVQGREKERDDVLASYRTLGEEKSRAEAGLERCLTECHQLRAQVFAREEELLRLRDAADKLEQDQYRAMLDLQTGQRHADGLSERVAELQAQLRLAASEAAAARQELASSRGVAALLERQKQDLLREAGLLRDEVVALRARVDQREGERGAALERLEAERRRSAELEGMLQALRARESAAEEGERGRTAEAAALQERLRRAEEELERRAQELRAARARAEEAEYDAQRRARACLAEEAEREGARAEAGEMRARLRELAELAERQAAALEARQEEATQLRLRLARMQGEAERAERRAQELEARVRRLEEAVRAAEASARQQQEAGREGEAERDELRAAARRAEAQLDQLRQQQRAMREAEGGLQGRLGEAAAALAETRGEAERLRTRLAEAQAQAGRFREESVNLSKLVEKLEADHRQLQGKYVAMHDKHRSAAGGGGGAAAAASRATAAAAAGGGGGGGLGDGGGGIGPGRRDGEAR